MANPAISLKDISVGQQNCKVFGRLIRLWDAINMRSKSADPLISIDVILLDELPYQLLHNNFSGLNSTDHCAKKVCKAIPPLAK
jgi:hypothetical protein